MASSSSTIPTEQGLDLQLNIQNRLETFSLPSLQVFQVHTDPCYVLTVTVVEGHKITKGWVSDLVDTPDPYVVLRVPGSPNGRKKTKHFDNTISPTWEETFTFVIDPNKKNELEVSLMDANYTIDQMLGQTMLDLSTLSLNEEQETSLKFGEVSEIILKLLLSTQDPDLRYGLALCKKEKEFRNVRRKFMLPKFQEILGEEGPTKENEIPTVSVLGSGGGFRAMTALSGCFKGLAESGILDCVMYAAGLSGSAWYLSTLYSHPEFPSLGPGELQEELKTRIRHSPFWLLSPRSLFRYISTIKEKYKSGQPVSFTDFFGHLLGDTLLKGRTDVKLSNQQQKIDDGKVPMPLYTCLHVKSNVSAKVFQDWIEFTPYEVGIAKYAAFMEASIFGSKLYKGKVVKQYPEFPLHYLQGVWGSAFTILFKRLIQDSTRLSLDLNPQPEDSDEDDDIFFDAEEEFHNDEEEHIRCLFDDLELNEEDEGKPDSENSDSEASSKDSSTDSASPKGLSRMLTSGFWQEFINNVCTSSAMNTRKGRAGLILNPLRGLSLVPCFPFSPFSPTSPNDDMLFKGLTEPIRTQSKTLYLVDGGLTFNLPFPLLLRPQRTVDLYLTFDFSSRDTDNSPAFKELLLAEKWARVNNCLFPPVHDLVLEYIKEPPKECYVFKHPTNEMCPIIIHFPLVNDNFRKYKKPGVERETQEELDFANFDIFSDPKKPYSIYNFKYPNVQFERLAELMEFNVLNNIEVIKENLAVVVQRKKKMLSQTEMILSEGKPERKFSKT